MCQQVTDIITVSDKKYSLWGFPLNSYWEKYNNRPPLVSDSTANSRGYYAKWLVEDERLYLVDFWGTDVFSFPQKEYSMNDIFPGENKVFAVWYNGKLEFGMGMCDETQGFPKYIATMKVEQGCVVDSSIVDNAWWL